MKACDIIGQLTRNSYENNNGTIPPHEVINRFGYLIKGKGKVSGLDFARAILKSGLDCVEFRENNASTAASIIYEIEVFPTRGYKSVELLLKCWV